MCLGIPAQLVAGETGHTDLVMAEVGGVPRTVNVGLLDEIHAMAGNPTGAMGVPDYLGWDWKSKAGLPIVCVQAAPPTRTTCPRPSCTCSTRWPGRRR